MKENKIEMEIEVKLIGIEEVISKLQELKKLLNDIASIEIEVKQLKFNFVNVLS